jgi:ribose transport system substrate-binding protein
MLRSHVMLRSNVMSARSSLVVLSAVIVATAVMAMASGCGRRDAGVQGEALTQSSSNRFPLTAGKYTMLGILTDNQDNAKAKENAETTLLRHQDVRCLVGLWSQNTPMILAALRSSNATGKVKVVGFDEHDETLQGIRDGSVYGTIVQQPYEFGYRSVQWLTQLARGQQVDVPDSGLVFIPHRTITADTVQDFADELAAIRSGNGPLLAADAALDGSGLRVAYITNSVDPFWIWADFGCKRAAGQFGTKVEVQMPSSGSVEEQKRFLETNMAANLDGVAISPIDPDNQVQMIDRAAAAMPLICHDSDAPASARLFYLGTSNYMAGRAAGKLIKEAVPEGGKVMLFVGKMEVLNAQERSQGIIDELADKPVPEIFDGV